jgi:hypothetical protein
MRLRQKLRIGSLSVFVLALFTSVPANADTAKDLQIAGRALTFLENGPAGHAVIGVVFDPAKPASVAQKDAVMAALGSGLDVGGVTLVGKPMEAGAVSGGVAALFVTTGVNFGAVASAAKSHKLVTVATDHACVASGDCVLGVSTSPKVEITVNRAAASAVGASFKSAFRMMITEI